EADGLTKTKNDLAAHISALQEQERTLQHRVKQVAAEKDALEKQVAAIAASIPPSKQDPLKVKAPIDQIQDAVAEKVELERQVSVLRKEAAIIRDALREQFKNPAKNVELWAKPEYRGVMTTVLVSPVSRYDERNDPSSPTGKWYMFTLELQF